MTNVIGHLCNSIDIAYGSTEFFLCTFGHVVDPASYQDFYSGLLLSSIDAEIKIVDTSGEILPVNTKGEIYFRGQTLMKEYYNDPEKTADVLTEDGWYKTDDIAKMDEDGKLYIFGRKSNMIISGGFNVVPDILENAIKACPGVDNVACVPVSDPEYYQVICACVILKPNAKTTEDAIRQFLEDLHNDKSRMFTVLPKFYMFVDSFPETTTGKTSKKEIQRMAEQRFVMANGH